MRPNPSTPSTLSASSTPPHFDRSQRPATSAACACGMLRASATSSPIVCSAAETTFDSGAFATTIPRRVAASTSTLSTPTPALPITFSRVARCDHVGSDLRRRANDQRVVAADDLLERRLGVDVDVESLAQELDPGVRDRLANEDLRRHAATVRFERFERLRNGDAALDVGAELGQRQLDRRERGRDVEDVEPADVADAEDLALQVRLARRERDAVAVAKVEQQLVAVDPVRRSDRGHDGRAVLVGREELEAHRLDARARGPAESHVPLERRLEAVVEDQPECDVEAPDQRDRGREGRVSLSCAALFARQSK